MGIARRTLLFLQCFRVLRLRFFVLLIALGLLAACGKPLTTAERQFANDLFGETLDAEKVRLVKVPKLATPFADPPEIQVMRGTEKACIRVPQPRGEAPPPQALALGNTIIFSSELQARDMALGWPRYLRFPQAIILAHELTHVWQWQNREWTGYAPWKAAAESLMIPDPYFSESGEAPVFFAFGYEQQAAIVEDYVCFVAANPNHARRWELRALLEPIFPVDHFDEAIFSPLEGS